MQGCAHGKTTWIPCYLRERSRAYFTCFYVQALTFQSCNRLSVEDLQLKNSQQMHVTFLNCAGVRASQLTVSSPEESPNTDGIHVSGSTNVKISDSVIATGDDCISIVGGSSSVTVTSVVCGPGHGIRYVRVYYSLLPRRLMSGL